MQPPLFHHEFQFRNLEQSNNKEWKPVTHSSSPDSPENGVGWFLRIHLVNGNESILCSGFEKVLHWGLGPHEDQIAEMVLI